MIAAALASGVGLFQYRNKTGTRRSIVRTARSIVEAVKRGGGIIILNDHADIACAVGADGVHLGQDDLPLQDARRVLGPDRIIGISTHSRSQAEAAEAGGADYIGFGPLFPTRTKDAGPVQGIERLRDIRRAVSLPIIAIGGISSVTAKDVIEAGAESVAVISAVLSAPDPKAAIGVLQDSILPVLGTRSHQRGIRK
ncbi:MAG: thiamine phosphate synthase [Nitrospirota bacterium]|nr:thiamine phosphate synthase [Nitrospirota bacterium]